MAYACIKADIIREYDRHRYVLEGSYLTDAQKKKYNDIIEEKVSEADYATSLKFLSECLAKYHGKNTIILIDEYDVPLENSYFEGFYDKMITFIRSLFESAVKTNDSLEFAVITGCLRISKESIFTGLNNLQVNSLLTVDYAEYFGFVQEEVDLMLEYYQLESKKEELKSWYDGYKFGNTEVYNPWSVINYVRTAESLITAFPKPYWSNTSSNSIVRELIERADSNAKKDIEKLIAGGTLEVAVHEDITYDDIYSSQDNLWNFLFFTGYLKKVSERFEDRNIYLTVCIPNEEILYVYENLIVEWFDKKVKKADFTGFYTALLNQECEAMEKFINAQLSGSISFHDSAESFYHGYMVGILGGIEGYMLESNREKGLGRPDIVLTPADPRKSVIIIELKRALKFTQMEEKCDEALAQIEEKQYAMPYLDEGYAGAVYYGICFCKKFSQVKCGGD
jgi:hypothetical protein